LIYLEFIDWDRSTSLEIFRYLSLQEQWSDAEDEKVINIGRHKGLGPCPTYLSGWRIRGFDRLDEWDRHFKSDEAKQDLAERATFFGLDFKYCGLYDDLVLKVLADDHLHMVEYVDIPDELADDEFVSFNRDRAASETTGELAVLLRKIRLLGPVPAGIAVWTFPDFASIETFVRTIPTGRLKPMAAGLFRNIGHELM
jgi:hypothetical protein